MPVLNRIGKEKVVNQHLDAPFRTLEKQYICSVRQGRRKHDYPWRVSATEEYYNE